MQCWICVTCGTQFPPGQTPPKECPICSDIRQYIGYEAQIFPYTTLFRSDGFHNTLKEHEPHLTGIGTEPTFAIGRGEDRSCRMKDPHKANMIPMTFSLKATRPL